MEASEELDYPVLAVVGSTQFENDPWLLNCAWWLIHGYVQDINPGTIISGGAPGIDTLAKRYADEILIPFKPFPPKNKRWKPEGFAERNLQIAEACTHLLAIRHHLSTTYGSGWTADRAEEAGRTVRRVTLG